MKVNSLSEYNYLCDTCSLGRGFESYSEGLVTDVGISTGGGVVDRGPGDRDGSYNC